MQMNGVKMEKAVKVKFKQPSEFVRFPMYNGFSLLAIFTFAFSTHRNNLVA